MLVAGRCCWLVLCWVKPSAPDENLEGPSPSEGGRGSEEASPAAARYVWVHEGGRGVREGGLMAHGGRDARLLGASTRSLKTTQIIVCMCICMRIGCIVILVRNIV